MAVRDRIRTTFICGNCEDDFEGFPSGGRKGDRRPLCRRCTTSGMAEETAISYVDETRVLPAPPGRFEGLKTLGYFVFAFFATAALIIFLCVQRVFK